jgi:hypothetical protein
MTRTQASALRISCLFRNGVEMTTKKRRHHYVWRNYLRPWASNEQIWCYRDSSYFPTNLMNIGQERDFYKLKNLSKRNIEIINKVINLASSEELKQINQNWVTLFDFVFNLKELSDSKGINDAELDKLIDEQIYNFEENIHGAIENNSIKFLQFILSENLNFYDNDDDCVDFLYFLCVQYMRTNNVKQNVIATIASTGSNLLDIENTWNILAHIFATNISCNLYIKRKNFKIVLLRNLSVDVRFITGDQPVINIHAKEKGKTVEKLELYYPVSPTHAILLTEDDSYISGEKRKLPVEEVDEYNKMIVNQSHEQLYASSKHDLERYRH